MRFLDLGVLQIEVEDVLISPGGPRTAAVLSALLLHLNQRVTVDLLLDAAWGSNPPRHADEALSSHIWRLRRLLEPARQRRSPTSLIHREGHSYRLSTSTEHVSSARFEHLGSAVHQRLVDEQPDRALKMADDALQLWRGAPFGDVAERSWAQPAVSRLERLQVQLQERRIGALIRLGDHDRAIVESDPLLHAHPLRERLWAQHMLACYYAGRLDEALATYQRARRTMRNEAGIDPGSELTDIHQQILRRDPALESRRGTRLSVTDQTATRLPWPRELIGRDDDFASLAQLLREGRPLVSIVGPAGSGKTALACETARAAAMRYRDGVKFVDLSSTTPDSHILEVIATVLGLSSTTREGYSASLRTYSRTQHALIVLDNCEQTLPQVPQICELLLPEGSNIQLLITSREPSGVAAETIHQLHPLSTVGSSTDPAASPAAALFLRDDRLHRSGADLNEQDRAAVARICDATDGLPLAIELAAGWTSAYTLFEIAEQVDQDPGALTAISGHGAGSHHTMHFAVDRSYRLLQPEEQALHRRLAVLPGHFSRQLAEELADDALSRRSIAGLLARLQHRSLLTATHHTNGTRFTQLATVRSHARHALEEAAETEAAETRRDAWTLDLFQRRPLGGRPEEAAWHGEVLDSLPTIRATLHRNLITHPNALGAAVACRMLAFWFYYGHTEEGLRWVDLAAERVADSCYDLAIIHTTQANLHGMRGDHAGARRALSRATALLPTRLQQPSDLVETLIALASGFAAAYDTAAMRAALDIARPIVAELGSPHLAIAFVSMESLADSADDPASASIDHAFSCYEEAEKLGNLFAAWIACSSVNTIALARRDAELGLEWSRRLISLQDRLGARAVLPQSETYADFLAMQQHFEHSVRVFAASQHAAQQAGAAWPRNPATQHLIAEARQHLTTDRFEEAWTLGSNLSRAELLDADRRPPASPASH